MKTPLAFASILFILSAAAFGQSSEWRKAIESDPRFSFAAPPPQTGTALPRIDRFEISPALQFSLGERFARPNTLKERINLGLQALAGELGASEFSSGTFTWKTDGDSAWRLRSSKLLYRYNPHAFPKDPLTFLDRAFGQPIRLAIGSALRF
jgi:hypothetical protein